MSGRNTMRVPSVSGQRSWAEGHHFFTDDYDGVIREWDRDTCKLITTHTGARAMQLSLRQDQRDRQARPHQKEHRPVIRLEINGIDLSFRRLPKHLMKRLTVLRRVLNSENLARVMHLNAHRSPSSPSDPTVGGRS